MFCNKNAALVLNILSQTVVYRYQALRYNPIHTLRSLCSDVRKVASAGPWVHLSHSEGSAATLPFESSHSLAARWPYSVWTLHVGGHRRARLRDAKFCQFQDDWALVHFVDRAPHAQVIWARETENGHRNSADLAGVKPG